MKVTITNVFTDESKVFYGPPLDVEEQIRELFPSLFDDIPSGDMPKVLFRLSRVHGFSVVIEDASDYIPDSPVRSVRPTKDDPWPRQGDL